jgi:hypothetical protein
MTTSTGLEFRLRYWTKCDWVHSYLTTWVCNVVRLDLSCLKKPDGLNNVLQVLPALDDELVAALRGLPLQQLQLEVGYGMLLLQLASLTSLEELIIIIHYCLRGSIPDQLMSHMPSLRRLVVTPAAAARQAIDPTSGVCGVSGRLPNVSTPLSNSAMADLDLSYNQLTGQLPLCLLSLATRISLQGNLLSGSIPSDIGDTASVCAKYIDLSDNMLEVIPSPLDTDEQLVSQSLLGAMTVSSLTSVAIGLSKHLANI